MDRASDSGSEGWGFESLLAYHIFCMTGSLWVPGFFVCDGRTNNATKNSSPEARVFGKGQPQSDMPPAYP